MLDCIQNKNLEIIATLTQADVAEFEKLNPELLGKLTHWLSDLNDLLEWLTGDWYVARDAKERDTVINNFLDTGTFTGEK